MRRSACSLAVAAACAIAATAALWPEPRTAAAPRADADGDANGDAKAPVVVELFTSQGCSSCPPADAFAVRLARAPGFVVLTRPVTYWDRLGWQDTLARAANTALQNAYAARLRGQPGSGVYTPQMVVAGTHGTVGANAAVVRRLADTARRRRTAALAIRHLPGGAVAIGMAGAARDAELVLVALTSRATVPIGRGENGGKTVTYANVVRAETTLADWRGGPARIVLGPAQRSLPGADRYAVVLREKDAGAVLAGQML